MTSPALPIKPFRRRRWRPATPTPSAQICWLLEEAVAAAFAVPIDAVRAPGRSTAEAAFARQCAMYLAHVALGTDFSKVGRMFHRDRTTVMHACQQVELRRDEPSIDRMLDLLENICVDLACHVPSRALP